MSDDPSIGAAIVVAIGSGLRRGELLALRWCDVDLDAGTIRVVRSIERVGETRFKEPKTPGSRRSVPLPAFAVERLRRHRREQLERFEHLALWRTNESLVFDHCGEPWNPNT